MTITTPTLPAEPIVTVLETDAGPVDLLSPYLRELLELERRQIIARLKLIEKLLGIAPKRE